LGSTSLSTNCRNNSARGRSSQSTAGTRIHLAYAQEYVMRIWSTLRNELREIVWLASMVGGLSALGVGLAVTLALAL
jgi:hypothetical protein